MECSGSEYFPQYIHPSNKGKQDLFGEWIDNIEQLDGYVFDKLANMEVNGEGPDYMDEDPRVLMLKEKGTRQEPTAITKAITELKNQTWEGAAHPMEDPMEKTKTTKPFTLVKFVCDHVSIPIESILVESVKNSISHKIIFDSAYFLALNVFISEIRKKLLMIRN